MNKMKSSLKIFVFILLATLLVVNYVNCGNSKGLKKANQELPADQPRIDNQKASVRFCSLPSHKIESQLKFIFVIDHSGSNINVSASHPSDPDGSRRYDQLIAFVNQSGASLQEDVYFSIIHFNDNATQIHFNNSKGPVILGSNPLEFDNTLSNNTAVVADQLQAEKAAVGHDGGGTDFYVALRRVRDFINSDLVKVKNANSPDKILTTSYIVFFVSDGKPDDPSRNDTLPNDVRGIVRPDDSLARYVDRIALNSAYYYEDFDGDASDLIESLADAGNGLFIHAGSRQNIDYQQFAPPTRVSSSYLVDMWIHNLNTLWVNDKFLTDSDSDFMADVKELEVGSNPLVADGDGDGVRDGIQFNVTGEACRSGVCSQVSTVSLRCSNLTHSSVSPFTFGDADGDGLNDCEETVMSSDPFKFDSNGDNIPDALAFAEGLSVTGSPNSIIADPDNDNLTNYFEMKINSPIRSHNKVLPILYRPMEYKMRESSLEFAQQRCYEYDIDNLATLPLKSSSQDNTVRIYLVENALVSGRRTFLRSATRKLNMKNVLFQDSDFTQIFRN